MKLVDANVLLYAVNEDSRDHAAAKAWLDGGLGGRDVVGLSWVVLLAFLRLSTHRAVFPDPLTADEATDQVESWLASPGAQVVDPGAAHLTVLRGLLGGDVRGNLVNDAHLAALALERRAEVVSYDRDFDRFSGIRRRTPDDLLR